MDPKQFQELCRTIAGGAILIGGAILVSAWPWVGVVLAFAGLWMMLYPPLKRWWKSDQTQTWWETGKKEPPSGEAPEDGKNEE